MHNCKSWTLFCLVTACAFSNDNAHADGLAGDHRQSAEAVAKRLLDASVPGEERERLVTELADQAAELVAAMTSDLEAGTPAEYERIPWIWRVSIAAARRNDPKQIKSLLDVATPKVAAPLRDWQAVVLGGGVINGLSQLGIWPDKRIMEIIGQDEQLARRWRRALELSADMADNAKVPSGTRYDALRMIPLQGWERRGEQLTKYLGKDVHEELQMGAVSGISDINARPAAGALIASLRDLTENNRKLAWDALLRTEERAKQLLDAVVEGKVKSTDVPTEIAERLKRHASASIRKAATQLLEKAQ